MQQNVVKFEMEFSFENNISILKDDFMPKFILKSLSVCAETLGNLSYVSPTKSNRMCYLSRLDQ